MKNYEVEIKPGVVTTLQLDDEHAKRLGVFKGKTAESGSKDSETAAGATTPDGSNKELTAAEVKAQNAAKRKADKEAAAKAAEADKG